MLAFITIIWDAHDEAASQDARNLSSLVKRQHPTWNAAFQEPGLLVFQRPSRARADQGMILNERTGFIAGCVFENVDGRDRPAALDAKEVDARRAVGSAGASLFDEFWGNYVAFLHDPQRQKVHVVRTPSAAVTCYYGRSGRTHLFFADPQDGGWLPIDIQGINWAYLTRRLCSNRFRSDGTAVLGVSEMAPGQVITVTPTGYSMKTPWTLEACTSRSPLLDPKEAMKALRGSVDAAAAALASGYDRVGLRLSGGLDSSILLTALANAQVDVRAVTYATVEADGEEREFARAVAHRHRVPLTEFIRDPARARLREAVHQPASIRPRLWLLEGEVQDFETQFALDNDLWAFFGGRGGDNVFFRSLNSHATADLFADQGLSLSWIREVMRSASRRNCSSWTVLREVQRLRAERRGRTESIWAPHFLSDSARDLLSEVTIGPDSLKPGQRRHVSILEDRLNYYDSYPYADYVYPLVSQPVMEAALRIPSYILSLDGDDRRLARDAFMDRLPAEIYARRTKGGTGNYLIQILLRDRKFLLDYLAGGALAEHDLVDPERVAEALSPHSLMTDKYQIMELVGSISVEAWLRSWRSKPASSYDMSQRTEGNPPVRAAFR